MLQVRVHCIYLRQLDQVFKRGTREGKGERSGKGKWGREGVREEERRIPSANHRETNRLQFLEKRASFRSNFTASLLILLHPKRCYVMDRPFSFMYIVNALS